MKDRAMETCLSIMAEYEMTQDEATAYKLCCIYHDAVLDTFPNYRHYKMPKGDPRKTSLFKYCYKLIQETKNKLKPPEYVLYIKAQMDVLKAITKEGDLPLIQPGCLVGEKAWTRWLMWKRRYEIKKKKFQETTFKPNMDHIKADLNGAKEFLNRALGGLTKEKIVESLDKHDMLLWVGRGQVSAYYFLLSPVVQNWLKSKKIEHLPPIHLDLDYFRQNITPEIKKHFEEQFSYEV